MTVAHVAVGPAEHGVVRYALSVHRALADAGQRHVLVRADSAAAVTTTSVTGCSSAHVHITDRLFGATPEEAGDAVAAMLDRIALPVSVTLHDVPQPSDGASMNRRVRFYAAVAEASAGVVVSSEHEASLMTRHVDPALNPAVIPLMVDRLPSLSTKSADTTTVGVLGFLYPGKGHLETVHAMRDLPSSAGFVALGTPSEGHGHLADDLRDAALSTGRSCDITGYLDDATLATRMADITVPVAFHRHMSASGSINTWIAAGRRPLVPRTSYTIELDRRSPGTVLVHGDDEDSLRRAIGAALDDPSSTWIDPSVVPVPSSAQVAHSHVEFFRRRLS